MDSTVKRYLLLIDVLGSGGAERQMGYLASCLKNEGNVVKLVTFYKSEIFYEDMQNKHGVEIVTRVDGKSIVKRPFVIRSLIREFKPDMVIAYKDGSSIASCLAKLICKFKLTVSERNTTQVLSKKERFKFISYRLADHIVTNSFSQADFIKNHFPTLYPKVSVITNMIDTERFENVHKSDENSPLRILTVARIMPQKNLKNFVEAVAVLRNRGYNLFFDWYGNEDKTDPQYKEGVLKRLRELDLDKIVNFHDSVKDIEKIYSLHDIFLLPSLYEGFPNVLCEAMACGMPAVATAVCDVPRILLDSRFLADPNSPESIADALERMINLSPEERKGIGDINSERIMSLCSPESFVRKYLSLK